MSILDYVEQFIGDKAVDRKQWMKYKGLDRGDFEIVDGQLIFNSEAEFQTIDPENKNSFDINNLYFDKELLKLLKNEADKIIGEYFVADDLNIEVTDAEFIEAKIAYIKNESELDEKKYIKEYLADKHGVTCELEADAHLSNVIGLLREPIQTIYQDNAEKHVMIHLIIDKKILYYIKSLNIKDQKMNDYIWLMEQFLKEEKKRLADFDDKARINAKAVYEILSNDDFYLLSNIDVALFARVDEIIDSRVEELYQKDYSNDELASIIIDSIPDLDGYTRGYYAYFVYDMVNAINNKEGYTKDQANLDIEKQLVKLDSSIM